MKTSIHFVIVFAFLAVTFFLYNKQMGSIPLLLLSFYLFFWGSRKFYQLKNKK